MTSLTLSLAIGDYDHVRDLLTGRVRAEGIEIMPINLPVEEIFYRFTRFQEWQVSEMSFAKYASLRSQDNDAIIAIPVFPSRMFRHSSIYVRADSGIERPEDLAGKRIGIPEWAQTAAIYTRGYLMHRIGIALQDVSWVQAGVNQPGRAEKVDLRLPAGVTCTALPDRSLSELLVAGEVDAVMSARPPESFVRGEGGVVRLFGSYAEAEHGYWRETGIFPIMHVIAMRRDIYERHPWIAMNLLKAFTEAKNRSLARALDITASHFPVPWSVNLAQQAQQLFGNDIWPYGIGANRVTLDAFLSFAHEQGVCHRLLRAEDLFAAEVQSSFRV
jgi:4,5-dihydroxyphthalate decarboxylase